MALLFAAVIYEPAAVEGIEGELILDTDLEALKRSVEQAVDSRNRALEEFGFEPGEFDWSDTGYGPEASLDYGTYAWAKIYEGYAGSSVRFSEFDS